MREHLLSIGQIARLAAVGVQTIRYYEREGLVEEPPRNESGYRQYSPETAVRIRFIRHAKELGFSLKEIKDLLSLRADSAASCADVRERATAKVSDIEAKMQSLARMREVLLRLTATCTGTGPTSQCPILDALDQDGTD
jgi:MerR family copper efflux transcriptional regulator